MISNKEIKKLTWKQLNASYWMLFVALIVIGAIEGATATFGVFFIIAGPFAVGLAAYQLSIINNNNKDGDDFNLIFDGFKNNFATSLVAWIVSKIFLILWTFLFIIPGIIKSYSYSQVFFIIQENPTIAPMEAIDKSREMMRGHKAKLFLLDLSFIGWVLLALIFTFGIGLFFLAPYISLARANFYNELRDKPTTNVIDEYTLDFE